MIPDLFSDLNAKQLEAVQQPLRAVLVLAGPGTGKTRLLVSRIAWSIRQQGLAAEKILAVTFTNKAAGEMRSRLFQLIGQVSEQVTISTFHSFALSLLRKYQDPLGLGKYFSVCNQDYQRHLMKNLCDPYIKENLEGKVNGLLLAFSNHVMKGKELSPFARERYSEYMCHLNKHHLIDFDQILVLARKLFLEHPDILEQYQFLFPAILVDEFQDTDPVQYDILYLLSRENKNIFVVADDDQSIYSWRGANPENIKRFMEEFNIQRPLFLETNYRSGQNILDCANRLITRTERIEPDKLLRVDNERKDNVEVKFFLTDFEEMNYILKKITTWQQQGLEYKDIALIYPFHRIGQGLEDFMIKYQIPYQMAEGRSLLDHPYLNKLLLYLRLVRDSNDQVALEEIAAAELGQSMYSFIKDQANRRNLTFRKALSQLYQDEEKSISLDAKLKMRRLVAHIANLVNLKDFFSFRKLLEEINSIEELQDSSFLSRYITHVDSLSAVEKLVGKYVPAAGKPHWHIYHPDKRIAFLAIELVAAVLQQPVSVYPDQEENADDRNRVLLELEPLPHREEKYIPIPLYRLKNEKRNGSLSLLFKFLQWYITREEKILLDRYIILDLETTDKDTQTCGIVEFAAVLVEKGQIINEMTALVNPERVISPAARAVHRIDQQMVQDQPTISQLWPAIKSFLGDDILVAHNGFNFDFIILDRVARKIDGQKLSNRRLDTLDIARNLYSNLSNSVDSLMERLGIKSSIRHRALGDVHILAEIFHKLQKEKNEISKKLSLEMFLDYVALGNHYQNTVEGNEDRIFFINGARKLITPYSRVIRSVCAQFTYDEIRLQAEVKKRLNGLNPLAGNFSSKEQLLIKIRLMARQYDLLSIDDAIAQFLSSLSLNAAQDELENINAVSLLTYHAAKGLEFEKVVIMGLENNNMPGFHSIREDSEDDRPVTKKLEEQRRLLYVGITRARNELILTVVNNRGGWQQEHSPFIKELQVSYSISTDN